MAKLMITSTLLSFFGISVACASQVAVLGPYDTAYCGRGSLFTPDYGESIIIRRIGHGEYEFVANDGAIFARECDNLEIVRATQEPVALPTDFLNVEFLTPLDTQNLSMLFSLISGGHNGKALGNCLVFPESFEVESVVGKKWRKNFSDGPALIKGLKSLISSGSCVFPSFNGLTNQKKFWASSESEMVARAKDIVNLIDMADNKFCSDEFLVDYNSYDFSSAVDLISLSQWSKLNGRKLTFQEKLCLASEAEKSEVILTALSGESFIDDVNQAIVGQRLEVSFIVDSLAKRLMKANRFSVIEQKNLEEFMSQHPEHFSDFLKKSCDDSTYYNSRAKEQCYQGGLSTLSFIPLSVFREIGVSYKQMLSVRPQALLELALQGMRIEAIYYELQKEFTKYDSFYNRSVTDETAIKTAMAIFKNHSALMVQQGTDLKIVRTVIVPAPAQLKEIAAAQAKTKSAKVDVLLSCGLSVQELYLSYGYTIKELYFGSVSPQEIMNQLRGQVSDQVLLSGMRDAGISARWLIDQGFKKKYLIEEIGYSRDDFKK